jgi:hypothetical protein
MRRATTLLVLAIALCGCAGDDDGGAVCEGLAGDYLLTLGPGTGTCDPDLVIPELMLPAVSLEPATSCGGRTLADFTFSGDCSGTVSIHGTVGVGGISDAQAAVEADCTPTGVACRHNFVISFDWQAPP